MEKISHNKFVFDNATFSNFARIKKLELIFYISKNIYTTKEVIEEINNGIKKRPNSELAEKLQRVIDYVREDKIKVETLKKSESILLMDAIIKENYLGVGEISAMALAKELNGIFITDDEKAIKKADRENIKILKTEDFGINILSKNEFRGTVIFLEILKNQKNISKKEFNEIKEMLKNENFIF